jgi:hypothetical protein
MFKVTILINAGAKTQAEQIVETREHAEKIVNQINLSNLPGVSAYYVEI